MSADDAAGILVSLEPEFARAIACGQKSVELRRRFPVARSVGAWLVIYVTLPVAAVVGMVRITAVEEAPPSLLWSRHSSSVALGKNRFDEYFAGCGRGYAVLLEGYVPVSPVAAENLEDIQPGLRPPQSFCYLGQDCIDRLVESRNA